MMEPLDASSAVPPHIKRTWFMAFVLSFYHRLFKSEESSAAEVSEDEDGTESASETSGTSTPNGNGLGTKYAPINKAGGRRRKAPKKR